MENKILSMWKEGKPVINGWLAVPSFFSAEVMANQGWDSLTVDMQHGIIGYDNLVPMLAAIKPSVTPLTRVPWLEPGIIMKSLDAGCLGVICPMVNSGDDAEQFVQAMRYAPRGRRSFGPTRVLLRHDDYTANANDKTIAMAMIETKQALDNIDDIMSTDGLTAVYIGPSDLALTLGHTPKLDHDQKEVVEAIMMILAKAKEHGLYAGLHNGSASYAAKMIKKGFNFVTIMSDARILAEGSQRQLAEVRGTQVQSSEGVY